MKKNLLYFVLPVLAVLALAGMDQLVKMWVIENIELYDSIIIWDGVFELTHIHNEGMAWGLFQNKQVFFIILTPIALLLFGYFYCRTPFTRRFIPIRIAEVMLAGGAIGNLIDRVFRGEELFHGKVIDMFYVSAIRFPVFNVADCYITVACVILIALVLFYYKDSEFNEMFGFKKIVKETDVPAEVQTEENDENH